MSNRPKASPEHIAGKVSTLHTVATHTNHRSSPLGGNVIKLTTPAGTQSTRTDAFGPSDLPIDATTAAVNCPCDDLGAQPCDRLCWQLDSTVPWTRRFTQHPYHGRPCAAACRRRRIPADLPELRLASRQRTSISSVRPTLHQVSWHWRSAGCAAGGACDAVWPVRARAYLTTLTRPPDVDFTGSLAPRHACPFLAVKPPIECAV